MNIFLGVIFLTIGLIFALGAYITLCGWRSSLDRKKTVSNALIFVAASGLLLLLGTLALVVKKSPPSRTTQAQAQAVTPAPAPKPPYHPNAIIAQAKREYERKDYSQAVVLLLKLHPSDSNRPEVKHLWNVLDKIIARQQEKEAISQRVAYARKYEDGLLAQGVNATVRAQGPGKRTLYLETPFMSKSTVYRMTHPEAEAEADAAAGHLWKAGADPHTDFLRQWGEMGFTRVIFADGFGDTWTYSTD